MRFKYLLLFLIVGLSGCYGEKIERLAYEQRDKNWEQRKAFTAALLEIHQLRAEDQFSETCNRFFGMRGSAGYVYVGKTNVHKYFPRFDIYCVDAYDVKMETQVRLEEVKLTLELLDKCKTNCKLED